MKDFDLRGKDYLTLAESAHYCGVSESQFRARAKEYGLMARPFMGKLLFRRGDLREAIEQTWRQYESAAEIGGYSGRQRIKSPR